MSQFEIVFKSLRVKESFKPLLAKLLRRFGDKSRNSLATETTYILTGRTGEYDPLKFKFDSAAKLLRDLSPKLFNLASKGLKLFFTLNCVLKRANDLKTISN